MFVKLKHACLIHVCLIMLSLYAFPEKDTAVYLSNSRPFLVYLLKLTVSSCRREGVGGRQRARYNPDHLFLLVFLLLNLHILLEI